MKKNVDGKYCEEFIDYAYKLSIKKRSKFLDDYQKFENNINEIIKKNEGFKKLDSNLLSYSYLIGLSEKYLLNEVEGKNIYPINTSYPSWIREKIINICLYDPGINTLKNYRLSLGYSQKKMAKALGVVETSYLNWERKKATPRFEDLIKLKEFFKIPDCDMWSFICTFKKVQD